MSEALKPCPFCGNEEPRVSMRLDEDLWSHNTVTWTQVRCDDCDASSPSTCPGFELEAVEAWNRRAASQRTEQQAGAAEPAAWEWRHLDTTNTPNTWSEWARVEPRNRFTDTVDDRVREFQAYIEQGYKYELRALYAGHPPAAEPKGMEPVDAEEIAILRVLDHDTREWMLLRDLPEGEYRLSLGNAAIGTAGCKWTYQDDPTYAWATKCGQMHVITDGTPAENDFKFCCYCGGRIGTPKSAEGEA